MQTIFDTFIDSIFWNNKQLPPMYLQTHSFYATFYTMEALLNKYYYGYR